MQNKKIVEISSLLFCILYSAFCLFVFLGCTKEKRNAANPLTNPSGPATLSSLQTDIIALGCATSGCHDNRATPAGSLNLSSYNNTYSSLLNRPSLQLSGMNLVTPNNPSNSYLLHKLQGSHRSLGGNGDRMPQYAAALSSAEIDRFINWINDGAKQN